jgi:hypothetical protein
VQHGPRHNVRQKRRAASAAQEANKAAMSENPAWAVGKGHSGLQTCKCADDSERRRQQRCVRPSLLSDDPSCSELEPVPEAPKSAFGRLATSGGIRGPPLRCLSVRKPGMGEGGAPQHEELAARVEGLRMEDHLALGGGHGPASAGGRSSPANASGRAVGFSPTPLLSVSKGGWRDVD